MTSLNLFWVYIIRNFKYIKYVLAVLIQSIGYFGFLNSLGLVDFDELTVKQTTRLIIAMILALIAWLFVTELTLLKMEYDIINNFQKRIEQQEEFNTLLEHLEESILILSERKIDFINDKCLDLLDPIIKTFKT